VRKQGQKPRQHGTAQSTQKLTREQLIFRIETLREKLEENPAMDEKRKSEINAQIAQFNQQLDRFF
jgi:hypothetical protein